MTESSKTASAAAQSVLLPQGDHAGKPGLPLGNRPFTLIGSRNRAHLHLLSTTISRSHACIISSKSGMYVRDLASRTGVLVNGRKVKEMDLQDGDMLEVGSFKFRLQERLGAIHLATTPRPALAMLEAAGGKLVSLDDRSILIGRRPTCEILLDTATVSSTHAIIFECDGQRYIRDLGSRTGTHINGELVHQQILHSGDQVRIGDASFRYVSSDAPPEELDEDSDTPALTADLVEEDELAPMPVPVGQHEDKPAHAIDTDDLAPLLHADHPERPADPIVAERMEHEAIPLAPDDELVSDAHHLQAEQAIPPVESAPAPDTEGEFAVADDDVLESQWLPIDFTEIDRPVTDLAAPVAEQGLTASADVLKDEEHGLDFWGPATETPVDLINSQVAHETMAPVAPETVPAEARAMAVPEAESLPVEETPSAIQGEPIAIEPAVAGTGSIELSPADVSGADLPSTTEVERLADAAPAFVAAKEEEQPAEPDPLANLDGLDLEDVPGEYPPPAIVEAKESVSEAIAPIAFEAEPTTTHHSPELEEVTALDKSAPLAASEPPAIDEVVAIAAQQPHGEQQLSPLADVVVEPAEAQSPAISPPTAGPEAIVAQAEPITTVELESELEAAASPVSQERHDEIVLPPLAVTSPVQGPDEEVQSSEPAVPLKVEAVDLSAVTFEAQSPAPEATEALAQPQPESSSAPQPLLDLTPVAHEEIALEGLSAPDESAVDEWVDSAADEDAGLAADPATTEKKARKPRTPRKKPTTPRRVSRRKKGEEVQAAIAAAEENQNLPPVPEAAAPQSASAAVALERVEHESAELATNAELPVAKPLFNLGIAELKGVDATQSAAEAEPLAPKSEPIIAQAAAEELATEAFYSGPADEAPLVSVDADEQRRATEPPMTGVTAQVPQDAEGEILSFEAAATTPEAREVMAAWHNTESGPTAFEAQPPPSTSDVIPALPAPIALTSEIAAVEPIVVEPSATESTSSITASVHEDVVPPQVPPAINVVSPDSDAGVNASGFESELSPEPEPLAPAGPAEASSGPDLSPVAEQIVLTAVGVETIENTEPTVESALDLEPSLAQVSETSGTADWVEVDTSLTDTAFGRAVSDFTGSGLGPLVEEISPSPHPAIGIPDSSDSFDNVLEDLPEFVMPASSSGDQADYLDAGFFDAEVFEANIDSGDLAAANLSADLPGEVPTPPQTLTLGEIADQPATVDTTGHGADITLTTAHDIESPPGKATDDEEFIAIGEDALIEPLEFDEELADELPAIDLFADSGVEAQPEPIAEEQPPLATTKETVASTPAPVVAEAPAPAPAPAQLPVKPPPLNPYFGMERDSGSFLGGMPLSFAAPLREPPRGSAMRPQNDLLPPPRLAPASAPETVGTPRSPFALISPVAPIHGLAPVPTFDPFQSPATAPKPASAQPQLAAEKTAAQEPRLVAEALPIHDESKPGLLADQSAQAPEAQAKPASLEDPDDILFQPEDPIELFDGAADKLDDLPDALDAIDDLEGALAEREFAELAEPAKDNLEATAPMTAAPVPSSTEAKASAPAAAPATPPPTVAPTKASAPPVFAAFSSMTSVAPPLHSLTGNPGPAKPAAPAAPVTVPPFAGSRPNARGSANPFAGMATPPPRLNTTDIFSQTTFPPPDEAMFRPQPIDIPPMKVRTPGVDPSAVPKRPEPRQQPGSRPGQHAAPPAQAQAGAQPPHKPAAPTPPKSEPPAKKKWWRSIRLLLPLMLLIMSAAVVAIVRLFPPRTLVQGTLQIKGLDQLNPMQRKDQIRTIRELLTKPDLRNTVVGSLATQGISPGFTQDPMALGALGDPENSASDRNLLILKRVSTDPGDDQKRMHALLLAVYSESKTPSDEARAAGDVQVKAAEDKVTALQTEYDAGQSALQKLTDQLRAATGSSAREVLQNPAAAIATLQRQHEQLGTALADANTKLRTARDVLDRIQNATVALPGTVTDPQFAGMQQNLNTLNARLASAGSGRGPALDSSTLTFDDSLQSLDQDLVLVALGARNNVASSYAARARQATAEMRELLSRQKQDRDAIALLKGQFADHREAYLMQVWANDETLKGLLGERDAQARRYRTAFDAANADEGAAARTEINRQDQKIDARRRELATGGQFADGVSQKLQQAIGRLTSDQQENERRMASDLALLDVPPAKNLPAGEQGSMASVGERVAAVQAARDQYAAAKTQDSGGETQAIQEEIAEQHARMDAYQQQIQADPPLLGKARESLAYAQDAEAKAQLAYADNLDLLASARELTDAQARVAQSRAAVATARADLETQRSQAGNFVQLQSPDDASTQLIYEPDQRHWYMIGVLGGLVALFAGPIWMGLRESHTQAPFASVVGENDEADADLEDFREMNAIEDEGHPAAV